jgi:putative endonuclease
MGKTYYIYIMSNKSRRLYTGITGELQARVFQHKNKWHEGSFTARYRFDMLVYFQGFSDPSQAIDREKEIKGWRREKKLRLILAVNPDWADLSADWQEAESWRALSDAKSRP